MTAVICGTEPGASKRKNRVQEQPAGAVNEDENVVSRTGGA